MFKNLPKRTKVMGGIAAGLLVLVLAGGVYGALTGKLAVRATTTPGGKLTGHAAVNNAACGAISAIPVTLQNPNNTAQTYKASPRASDGYYEINGVPLNISFNLSAGTPCGGGSGTCKSGVSVIKFTSNGQALTKDIVVLIKTGWVISYVNVGGATVTISGAGNSLSQTDSSNKGWVKFESVKVGTITVKAFRSGYKSEPPSDTFNMAGCVGYQSNFNLTKL